MMKVKTTPWAVIGTLLFALAMVVAPAHAQGFNVDYDDFNSAKVMYVGSDIEFQNAIRMLNDLPQGTRAPVTIRFIKAGVYHAAVTDVFVTISNTFNIEGPGSFYMDPSGQIPDSSIPGFERTLKYGVTIVGGIDPDVVDSGSSANQTFQRFIDITGGTVNISGLTLMNFGRMYGNYVSGDKDGSPHKDSNFYPDAYGGTIRNAGNLTLTNVTILNSRVVGYHSSLKFSTSTPPQVTPDSDYKGGSALGGAIYNSGTLTMRGCTIFNSAAQTVAFDDGTAALGGAIYNASSGTMNIANCTFEDNHVYGNREFDGQGNYYGHYAASANAHGEEIIAGGRIVGGGAIAIDGGDNVTIQNITVTNNTAEGGLAEKDGEGVFGAGIYWRSGFSRPYNSIFAANRIEQTDWPGQSLFQVQDFANAVGATTDLRYIGNGVRPEFQHANSTTHTNQFRAVSGNPVGPNTAQGSSGDPASLLYEGTSEGQVGGSETVFSWGYGGTHNIFDAGWYISYAPHVGLTGNYLEDFLTDFQDNGGQTLTRAPKNTAYFSLDSVPNPNLIDRNDYRIFTEISPVDTGSVPHVGTTLESFDDYLSGIDQRGAKRVVHGRNPDSVDTSQGATIVDIGAVEANFRPGTHELIKEGGNTRPFIERNWDTGITDSDKRDEDGNFVDADGNFTGTPNPDIEITGIVIKDADEYNVSEPQEVEVTIDFPDGKIITNDLFNAPGITVVFVDEEQHRVVIRGTIAAINDALSHGLLLDREDAQLDYPPNFSITVDDLGNYGYGGDEIYSDIVTHHLIDPVFNPIVYIQPVNHPPNVLVPGTQFVQKNEDNTEYNKLVFSRDNGNAIYVSDPDINAPIQGSQGADLPPGYDRSGLHLQVTLTVSSGSISLGDGSGVTLISSGSSQNGGTTITIEGSPTALNNALNGLSYRPKPGTTQDNLNVHANDLGNYGQGGPLTKDGNVKIIVTADGKNDGSVDPNDPGQGGSSTIRWEVTNITSGSGGVSITYTLTNLSNTDITNITASGTVRGNGNFDNENIDFQPTMGSSSDIRYQFTSPKLQRDLDPSKNGLSATWTLTDSHGNPVVLRQGRDLSLVINIPANGTPQAGQPLTGPWSVNFMPLDSEGNATRPGPTPSQVVP